MLRKFVKRLSCKTKTKMAADRRSTKPGDTTLLTDVTTLTSSSLLIHDALQAARRQRSASLCTVNDVTMSCHDVMSHDVNATSRDMTAVTRSWCNCFEAPISVDSFYAGILSKTSMTTTPSANGGCINDAHEEEKNNYVTDASSCYASIFFDDDNNNNSNRGRDCVMTARDNSNVGLVRENTYASIHVDASIRVDNRVDNRINKRVDATPLSPHIYASMTRGKARPVRDVRRRTSGDGQEAPQKGGPGAETAYSTYDTIRQPPRQDSAAARLQASTVARLHPAADDVTYLKPCSFVEGEGQVEEGCLHCDDPTVAGRRSDRNQDVEYINGVSACTWTLQQKTCMHFISLLGSL